MAEQIDKLAHFIMANIEGEPSKSEGAGDTAIRIIEQLQSKNDNLKTLWNQYADNKGSQVAGSCFRAMDKAVNPETYKKEDE